MLSILVAIAFGGDLARADNADELLEGGARLDGLSLGVDGGRSEAGLAQPDEERRQLGLPEAARLRTCENRDNMNHGRFRAITGDRGMLEAARLQRPLHLAEVVEEERASSLGVRFRLEGGEEGGGVLPAVKQAGEPTSGIITGGHEGGGDVRTPTGTGNHEPSNG